MKKILTMLALVIAAAIITGCGAGGGAGDTGTGEAAGTANGAGNNEEMTVITAILAYPGADLDTDPSHHWPSFQRFEYETNIRVDWTVIRSGWADQKALLLAAMDLPDTWWGNRTLTMTDIQTNPELFMRLNDFIDNSTNISIMFDEEPDLRRLVTFPDGSIYTLPHRMPLRPDTFDNTFINQVWLDNLGLPMPYDLESFRNTLIAFRDDDPNQNELQDEIPWTWPGQTGTAFGVYWIFGSWGLTCNIFGERIMIRDGELVFINVEDGWRDGIIFLADLYSEGLIDAEVFTHDWGMWFSKVQDPSVIVGVTTMWNQDAIFGPVHAYQYVPMPPLRGPDGQQRWRSNPINLRSSPNTWAMSSTASNPEAAFALIDFIYDPMNSVQLYFGSFGVGTELLPDGRIDLLPHPDPGASYDSWLWENSFGDMGPYFISRSFEMLINPNDWVSVRLYNDAVYQPFLPDPANIFPTMIFTQEETAELAILRTDIENFVDMRFAAWVTGERNIHDDWDDYLAQLEAMGLPRLMEIYRTRYEEFMR